MEDGNAPLDNSDAERAIRDFAVLRHSTASGFASVEGAKSLAVFSSFHETCKKTRGASGRIPCILVPIYRITPKRIEHSRYST